MKSLNYLHKGCVLGRDCQLRKGREKSIQLDLDFYVEKFFKNKIKINNRCDKNDIIQTFKGCGNWDVVTWIW